MLGMTTSSYLRHCSKLFLVSRSSRRPAAFHILSVSFLNSHFFVFEMSGFFLESCVLVYETLVLFLNSYVCFRNVTNRLGNWSIANKHYQQVAGGKLPTSGRVSD